MAIAIFHKIDNSFHKAFDTQALVDEYGYNNTELFVSQSISDDEWNKIKNGTHTPNEINTETSIVDWVEYNVIPKTEDQFKIEVSAIIGKLEKLENNSRKGHSQETKFFNYKKALELIDYSSITFPLASTLEQYMNSQGHAVVCTHEIP